jgi:hypothetical protein
MSGDLFRGRLGLVESATKEASPMPASHTSTTALSASEDWRELAIREGDGIEIRLFWSASADRVKVAVADSRLGEAFEFDVAGAHALAAFYHPFAYAPSQSFGSIEVEREALNLHQQA